MVGGVHGEIVGPPCAGSTLKLMGSKESLPVVLAPEKHELLLNGMEPVVPVKGILSTCERRWLSLKEVQKVVASGSTSSLRGRVAHKSFKKDSLSLPILLNLHQHICNARRWGQC